MMQLQTDKSHRVDEIKTQFRAREGYYRLMNSPDYSQRSQRAMGFSTGTANSNSSTATHEKTCIKISLVIVNEPNGIMTNIRQNQQLESRSNSILSNRSSKIHRRSKGARDMKICFNVGKELFVYNYDGVKTGPDASNPIYKRFYKGSSPTCHDFNQSAALSGSISLLAGFAHGQVQLIDLNGCDDTDACKEFNSERFIDRTRVTCVKWLPGSSSLFLVAHASGQLYLYKDDLPCGPTAPVYQLYKQSDGVSIYTCKSKTSRNPIYKWSIGSHSIADSGGSSSVAGSSSSLFKLDNESCSLNEFAFSPCAKYLACVSQDGFLRVYCYDTMELVGRARSYYGGLTCACWSPDGKYVVTGGEDDLITVWSFLDRRVVARGVGHKSWVSAVSFDPYRTGYNSNNSDVDNYDEDDDEEDKEIDIRDLENDEEDDYDMEDYIDRNRTNIQRALEAETRSPTGRGNHVHYNNYTNPNLGSASRSSGVTTYRFGSVGQDTQLCLWDLSDDLLQQPVAKPKTNTLSGSNSINNLSPSSPNHKNLVDDPKQQFQGSSKNETSLNLHLVQEANTSRTSNSYSSTLTSGVGLLSSKGSAFTKTFSLVGKRDKRYFSKSSDKTANQKGLSNGSGNDKLIEDPIRLLGSPICPRMSEVPLIEPTVCKKISFERLTSLIFCRGGFITSCQDGFVFSWARPFRRALNISPGQSNEELRVIDVGTSSAV